MGGKKRQQKSNVKVDPKERHFLKNFGESHPINDLR
jgi:hypothetical protein